MENKKLELRVTQAAWEDIFNIGLYTQTEWGDNQRRAYLSSLDERLEWLRQHYELGKNRDYIHEGYWSYPQGQHLIFYRYNEANLEVIGIIHQESDYENTL